MTGSHLDSVPYGGDFDGVAGVLCGLVMLERLSSVPQFACDIPLVVLRAEEMVWFPEHYLGSSAAFGLLPADAPDRIRRSDTGRALSSKMLEAGLDPEAIRSQKVQLNKKMFVHLLKYILNKGPNY